MRKFTKNEILNQKKFNELGKMLKGKILNYENIEVVLIQMGFKKAPDIRISKIVKIKNDNKIWSELRYNNLNLRVSLNNNMIVL